MRYLTTNIAAVLFASTLLATPLQSQAFASNFSSLFSEVDEKGGSGKSKAAAQAQAQYGGKVLSVSESKSNGQIVYKVKLLLDSGRIKIVTIQG